MEIPGYIIEKQIGKGGMARVYLALHEGLDRKVAIKVMNRQMDDDDSDFSDRFMREARIVANLTHQYIVTVYDVGMHDGYHYIAMEYLPGGITLDHKLKEGLSLQEGLTTIKHVAAALGFAHSKDIVHRDVKPENIMYREDGSAVLTDFGIARATTSATKMTATGTVIGTPHYMSPEQAQGQEIGAFSDIYSLGVVFYEVLTGNVPYDAESTIAVVFKHITEPVPKLEGEIAVFQPILDRMMAKTREERYETCDQIIADINSITGGGFADNATIINDATIINNATVINKAVTDAQARQTQQAKKEKTNKKLFAALAVGAVAAIALIIGGYYYSQQSVEEERLAQQARQQQIKQAELKAQQEKALAEKQSKTTKLTAKQEYERKKAAALKQQQEKEAQLAAKQKAEKEAQLAAQQAAAKKAADQAWREKQAKINKLLATAEQQLLNTQLDKAYKTYQSALKQDSGNKRARSGVTRVADQYLSLANVAAAGYDFDTANKHISTVIKIAPTHSKLADTQAKVFAYKNEQMLKLAEEKRLTEEQAASKTETAPEPEQKKRRSFGGF